jgi:hypothetical protein
MFVYIMELQFWLFFWYWTADCGFDLTIKLATWYYRNDFVTILNLVFLQPVSGLFMEEAPTNYKICIEDCITVHFFKCLWTKLE